MQQFRKFIYKHKTIIFIILLLILPACILFFLRFSNFINSITGIDLYINGISNGEMFAFLGSYIGGVVTLAALYVTIHHNKSMMLYQSRLSYFISEKENISKALSKINTLAAFDILTQYMCLSSKKYSVGQRKNTAPHRHRI